MPNPIISAIGSTVGSALQARAQSNAASRAGAAQTAEANAQIEEARRQFDTVQQLLRPYVNAGSVAQSGVMNLLGYGGGAQSSFVNGQVVGGGAPLEITTIQGQQAQGGGVDPAALQRARSMRQRGPRFEQAYQDLLAQSRAPQGTPTMYQVGGQTFATLQEAQAAAQAGMVQQPGQPVQQPGQPQITADQAQADAIARVRNGSMFNELTQQGEEAILANAAATGGLRGGNVQGALAQYRPAMLQQLIDRQLTALGGIAANGQNAAGGLATAAQNAGTMAGAAMGQRGAAAAGTAIAQGRAASGFYTGLGTTAGDLAGSWSQRPANAGIFDKWGF